MIRCAAELRKEANHGRSRYHCSTPDTARAFGDSAAVTHATVTVPAEAVMKGAAFFQEVFQ